jgi:LuxR family maltose regulon positive regulatory protein
MGRPWNQWESLTTGYFGLARIRTAQGDFVGAHAALQELADMADRLKYGMVLPAIQSQKTLLSARRGDYALAKGWIDSSQLPLEGPVPFWLEGEVVVLARVLICLGRYSEAARQASRVLLAAEAEQCQGRIIETLALRSVALSLCGEIQAAQEDLLRALALAQPEGYMRVFLDEGEPLRKLLLSLNISAPLQDYTNQLLSAFQPEQPPQQIGQARPNLKVKMKLTPLAREAGIEPLSERELDVLRLMAGGLTNQEIADSLVISLNTVKTHVKNILAHLEASNRTEAIAHARQLGLI